MESKNIILVKGNIFDSKMQTIVNTVNCVGVMGKGLALLYKIRFPKMFERYKQICSEGLLDIGKLWLWKESDERWILNFPTKRHWRYPSEYSYIISGLEKFVNIYRENRITSIAFPLLGCTNGKLDKEKVLKIMEEYLSKCDIPIEIYEEFSN